MQARLGAYDLIRPLGAGGMAETFVAQRSGPGGFRQRVCLKRILPQRSVDAQFVELFLDEARLLAQMRNGRIVQVYDFGECDGTYYMALELVEGVDLEKLLARSAGGARMPEELAIYVVSELLSALAYAHTLAIDGEPMQIVHRDISPSNVLISREGEVKLTDFGIAKARRRTHRTQVGETKGKLAYMSPEQMRAEALDCRSDLFAVGIVLHELVSGVHPFEAATDVTLIANLLYGQRPSFQALAPHASGRLVAAVDALLEPDPANRPLSALEALQLLPSYGRSLERKHELASWVARSAQPLSGAQVDTLSAASTPPPSPAEMRLDRAHAPTLTARRTTSLEQSADGTLDGEHLLEEDQRHRAEPSNEAHGGRQPWKLLLIAGGAVAATVASLHLSRPDVAGSKFRSAEATRRQGELASQHAAEATQARTLQAATTYEEPGAAETAIQGEDMVHVAPAATSPRTDAGAHRFQGSRAPAHRLGARVPKPPIRKNIGNVNDIEHAAESPRAGHRTKTSFSTDDF